jgi:hypothetical protein
VAEHTDLRLKFWKWESEEKWLFCVGTKELGYEFGIGVESFVLVG